MTVLNLCASYNKVPVLCDLSFSVSQGEFTCLCGPNGAGKSTLLSVLAGVPDAGLKVTGDTGEVSKLPRREAAGLVAWLQQNEYSQWDFSVRDYVLQGRYAYTKAGRYTDEDLKIVDGVLGELGLGEFAERTIHGLSGGEFQKVRLARSFAQNPRYLLLDEPAANLDYVFEPQLMSFLRETAHSKNIGVLAAVHDINLAARFADKIILLPQKKSVLYGKPSDIMNLENLRYTFGVDFECKEIKSFQSLQ